MTSHLDGLELVQLSRYSSFDLLKGLHLIFEPASIWDRLVEFLGGCAPVLITVFHRFVAAAINKNRPKINGPLFGGGRLFAITSAVGLAHPDRLETGRCRSYLEGKG